MTLPGFSDGSDASSGPLTAIVQADLPLGAGLRAVAAETKQTRTAGALTKLADALDAGVPLAKALAGSSAPLPPDITALLGASQRSGRLREALVDMVEQDVSTRETLRSAYSALAYPLTLALFAYLCLVFLYWFVVGDLLKMLDEFELDLPPTTQAIASLYAARMWLIILPVVAVVLALVAKLALPRALQQRLIAVVPLFGALFHWTGVAQATRALAHLIQQEVPLPEALRLSSQGLRDANVAEVWRSLAHQVESGAKLSHAVAATHRLPASLAPLLSWGEQTHNLAEALFMASEMLEGRVRLRAQMIRTTLPALMFIAIGGGAFFHVSALLGPMISLIQFLSG